MSGGGVSFREACTGWFIPVLWSSRFGKGPSLYTHSGSITPPVNRLCALGCPHQRHKFLPPQKSAWERSLLSQGVRGQRRSRCPGEQPALCCSRTGWCCLAGGPGGRRGRANFPSPHRFIQQVNLAAVTIQRWYRRHSQRHKAGAAALGRLLASKREVSPVHCLAAQTIPTPSCPAHLAGRGI